MRRSTPLAVVALALIMGALSAHAKPGKPSKLKAENAFDPHQLQVVHLVLTQEAYQNLAPAREAPALRWFDEWARRAATRPSTQPAPHPATRQVHPLDEKAAALPNRVKVDANSFGLQYAYVRGRFVFNGHEYADVGIRWKGNSSYTLARNTLKKPLKIDFDRFREDQTFLGLEQLNFSNNALDPSMIRESLSYWAFRKAGLPAPRTTFALVYLTVEGVMERQCLGVYTMIEEVDEDFLKSHFGTKGGLLLKPEGAHNLTYRGNKWEQYSSYDPKTDGTPQLRQRLIDFLWLIHESRPEKFNQEIDGFLDIDAFLRFLAINALLSNMDSFLATGHNFYLYAHPETGKFIFLPWDLNLSVGGYLRMGSSDELADLSLRRPHVGRGTLIERVLAAPGMEKRYLDHIRSMSNEFFNVESLSVEIAAMERAVAEGERKAHAFSPAGPATQPSFAWWKPPPTPLAFVTRRVQSVEEQLAGKTSGYVPRHRAGPLLNGRPPRPANPPAFAGAMFKALDNDGDARLSEAEVLTPAMEEFEKAMQREPEKQPAEALTERTLKAVLEDVLPKSGGRGVRFRGESAAAALTRTLLYEVDRDKDSQLTRQEVDLGVRRLFGEADRNDDAALTEAEFGAGLAKLFTPGRW